MKFLRTPTLNLILLLVTGADGLFLAGCGRQPIATAANKNKPQTLYTCGMDPQVVQDHPGNCPICGMKLTPIRKQPTGEPAQLNAGVPSGERKVEYYRSSMIPGETSATPRKDSMGMDMIPVYEGAAGNTQTIAIDPVTIQTMGVRTAEVTRGPLRREIRMVGTIEYNEAGLADVTTKFKGWVERLYVDTTGQQVHRGEPLFEIYSPELYSAQVEYLLATGTHTNANAMLGNETLRTSARNKLKFFDISEDQIAELERTRHPSKTLRIVAPIDGFVVDKMVVEGQMVDAGMKLYRLADLALVWVQAQVYEQDLAYIRLGQETTVSLSYLPDREFRGRVTYVYPNVDEKTRTARVRMEFHNPGYFLKPGMFAEVRLLAELEPSALLVPDMAILRSGQKNTIFVALDGGKFEPRTVTLGPQAENDMYQVLSGLKQGERIVTSGQFMLDSESQLREAIQKMQEPAGLASGQPASSQPSTVAAAGPGAASTPSRAPQAPATLKYICPMPEHVSIEYEHPGKCPLCGMALVPVSESALRKLQPGGKVLYYTCPMPEHSDVHENKPGKCRHCGMTLIPVMAPPPTPAAPTSPAMPAKLYTCPMVSDADVVSDQRGKCPKCEMDLVPTSSVPHGKTAEENWRKQHGEGA
jgi:membrane fusion protein, copper/silver efflux system